MQCLQEQRSHKKRLALWKRKQMDKVSKRYLLDGCA